VIGNDLPRRDLERARDHQRTRHDRDGLAAQTLLRAHELHELGERRLGQRARGAQVAVARVEHRDAVAQRRIALEQSRELPRDELRGHLAEAPGQVGESVEIVVGEQVAAEPEDPAERRDREGFRARLHGAFGERAGLLHLEEPHVPIHLNCLHVADRPLRVAIFGWVAEQERTRLIERTKAGLEQARRQGTRLGRPPASPVLLHAARDLVAAGIPVAEAARRKGVARSTLQRFMRAPTSYSGGACWTPSRLPRPMPHPACHSRGTPVSGE
jgi:hypothetical protein